MIASQVTSCGNCYGPLSTTNHGSRSFYAAAGSRYGVHGACAADDVRLPVNFPPDQYYDALPQQQQQQQQELGWFSVRNMLVPLNAGTTTTGMPTSSTTYLDTHTRRDDDVTGIRDIEVKLRRVEFLITLHRRATECHLPYGITRVTVIYHPTKVNTPRLNPS